MTLALAFLMTMGGLEAETLLRVRPHVVVAPGTQVRLAQLVDAQDLSDEGRRQLGSIILSSAPEYGERQEIANANLTALLRPIVAAERQASKGKVLVVIPKSVIVDTVKREIAADLVTGELTQAWQPLCADCKLEVEGLSLPKIQGVRDWSLKIKAELPRGSFSVPVEIVREDGSPAPAWVSGRLVTKRKVPVLKRMMSAQERLQSSDVVWEFRDTSFAVDGTPEEDQIDGKKVKLGLRAGDILWSGSLEKEMAIRRGDPIVVKSGTGMWEVSVNAVAAQDASIGDVISLKQKNGAQLTGMVVGQGEVELR